MAQEPDNHFMTQALGFAVMSPDPDRQVGAVFVKDGTIVAYGWNRIPPRLIKQGVYQDTERKRACTIHAEEVAIVDRKDSLHGSTMYCTRMTCHECAKLVIYAGAVRVVVPKWRGEPTSWEQSFLAAEARYQESGVMLDQLEGDIWRS